jgi:MurNAc alpha-1-phosphate uridylyltransferase
MITQAFIMAAGEGNRMLPLTKNTPKPLLKIKGISMLENIIKKASNIESIERIIVNGYYLSSMVKDEIERIANKKVIFSEEKSKLETGGALINALKLIDIDQSLAIINSDTIWEEEGEQSPILKLAEKFNRKKFNMVLGLKKTEDFFGYRGNGDFSCNGYILNKSENPTHCFVGLQIIKPRILLSSPAEPFSLNYFYKECLSKSGIYQKIQGIKLDNRFFHIGDIKAKEEFDQIYNKNTQNL